MMIKVKSVNKIFVNAFLYKYMKKRPLINLIGLLIRN